MKCSPVDRRWVAQWSSPPLGVLKSNVNRAAGGKPGLADIGDVLCNSNGNVLFMFSKNVSVCDSNEANVLAILEALSCFSENF